MDIKNENRPNRTQSQQRLQVIPEYQPEEPAPPRAVMNNSPVRELGRPPQVKGRELNFLEFTPQLNPGSPTEILHIQNIFLDPRSRDLGLTMLSQDERNSLKSVADVVQTSKNIILLTGDSTASDQPINDGLIATAFLAKTSRSLGAIVTCIADARNITILRNAIQIIDAEMAEYSRFIKFDERSPNKATEKAKKILDDLEATAVVAISLAGRNKKESIRDVENKDIGKSNALVDEFLIQAIELKIKTVAIGDCINKAGMGDLDETTLSAHLVTIQAKTRADYVLATSSSSLAAHGISAVALARANNLGELPSSDIHKKVIDVVFCGGAIDGTTLSNEIGAVDQHGNFTGVQGRNLELHGTLLENIRKLATLIDSDMPYANVASTDEGPFLAAAFDSSSGAFVAINDLIKYISFRSHNPVRFVAITDHGNAPYGQKDHKELVKLVKAALVNAVNLDLDVIVMACNTACTALSDSLEDVKLPPRDNYILNLIESTSKAIVEVGGSKPVVLATPATASATKDSYIQTVAKLKPEQSLDIIGCDKWADIVNKGEHVRALSHPAKKQEIKQMINRYIKQIPKDATSVWLCCTHFPALKSLIKDAMDELGMDMPLLDPMEYQAENLINYLKKNADSIARVGRIKSMVTIIITTGEQELVATSAVNQLGGTKIQLLAVQKFTADGLVKEIQELTTEVNHHWRAVKGKGTKNSGNRSINRSKST